MRQPRLERIEDAIEKKLKILPRRPDPLHVPGTHRDSDAKDAPEAALVFPIQLVLKGCPETKLALARIIRSK
jgi:hypothetical protein